MKKFIVAGIVILVILSLGCIREIGDERVQPEGTQDYTSLVRELNGFEKYEASEGLYGAFVLGEDFPYNDEYIFDNINELQFTSFIDYDSEEKVITLVVIEYYKVNDKKLFDTIKNYVPQSFDNKESIGGGDAYFRFIPMNRDNFTIVCETKKKNVFYVYHPDMESRLENCRALADGELTTLACVYFKNDKYLWSLIYTTQNEDYAKELMRAVVSQT